MTTRPVFPPSHVDKIRKMLAFLQDMEKEDEIRAVPGWRPHRLSGERRGTWSLYVTRNWRLTFRIDRTAEVITDLDFEDYHYEGGRGDNDRELQAEKTAASGRLR